MFPLITIFYFLIWCNKGSLAGHAKNLAWNGGPLHLECEHSTDLFTNSGQYVSENVIAVKAVSFNDEIYVLTPRLKRGVLATTWMLVQGRRGVELQAFPDLRTHSISNCQAIQNAIDFHLDHFGNLWILDSGIVETIESPRCTCQPKIVILNILLKKITKYIELSSLTESNSLLQYIVVEYGIGGKPFAYISDASRGLILVHDMLGGSEWAVLACAPSAGLQLALVKRSATHTVLVIIRVNYPGILELDTASIRRKNSLAPLRVFGDHTKPVLLLGSDGHHVYMRHAECSDVLAWDTRQVYNASLLVNIHSPGPNLTPTSAISDLLKHEVLILDSNYANVIHGKLPIYHRITFIKQL